MTAGQITFMLIATPVSIVVGSLAGMKLALWLDDWWHSR